MDLDLKKIMEKTWVQYLLYAILFLIIYFCFVRRKVREAFEIPKSSSSSDSDSDSGADIQDSKKISTELKEKTTKLHDGLHLAKYRSHIEDMIIEMNEWSGAKSTQMLPALAKKLSESTSDGVSDDIIQDMDKLNTLFTFNATLNAVMKHVDSK